MGRGGCFMLKYRYLLETTYGENHKLKEKYEYDHRIADSLTIFKRTYYNINEKDSFIKYDPIGINGF